MDNRLANEASCSGTMAVFTLLLLITLLFIYDK